jgi:hypothetical protein
MNVHRKAWEETCQKRFPHLTKEEAIAKAKRIQSENGKKAKGIKKPGAGFGSNSELARRAALKRWGKDVAHN